MKNFIKDIKYFITPMSLLIAIIIYFILGNKIICGLSFIISFLMMVFCSYITNGIHRLLEDEYV